MNKPSGGAYFCCLQATHSIVEELFLNIHWNLYKKQISIRKKLRALQPCLPFAAEEEELPNFPALNTTDVHLLFKRMVECCEAEREPSWRQLQ